MLQCLEHVQKQRRAALPSSLELVREAATWPADGGHWAAQATSGGGSRRGVAALHGATRRGLRSSCLGRAARPAMAAGRVMTMARGGWWPATT
jgi:hypothetical protein